MLPTCERRLQFCAGHRVYGHESKCANVHGHNYVVWVEATPDEGLDRIGRVVDFSVLKGRVGGWIEEHWDHGMLICEDDPLLVAWQPGGTMAGQKFFRCPFNPTAENMALFLLEFVCPLVLRDLGVRVTRVVVEETENCRATAALVEVSS